MGDGNETNGRLKRRSLWTLLALPLGLAAAGTASRASAQGAPADMATRLDQLESRQQITELLYAYARGNDRVDAELLRACFWPESTHKHGGFDGTSSDFIDFAIKIITPLKFTAHHISNVSIELKGDAALSECHYFAHHRRTAKSGEGEEDAFFEGRYIDRLERRGGVWKIIQRRGLSDFSTVLPAAKPFAEWPEAQRSHRFPDDDYYRMRERLRSGT